MRLLQHRDAEGKRSIVVARGGVARLLAGADTVYELASRAIRSGSSLSDLIEQSELGPQIDLGRELVDGRLLAPIDHPDPAHLHMTGTGLTHLGSAAGRDQMHKATAAAKLTDSMRMFLEGVEGGKPTAGQLGQQPEWFYKGNGTQLVGPEAELTMPFFAEDGGEEPELAGIYLIGADGTPFRLGFCLANEFSDHVTERHNYLWLAHSKLRQAALGAELLVGVMPDHIEGESRIRRNERTIWTGAFLTGEKNMSHSIANLEYHHFKYSQFRHPGDVHVHFFGTATLSFTEGLRTEPGDVFEIEAKPFSLPLRNRLVRAKAQETVVYPL